MLKNVQRVQEPYKNANRKFHPDNTVIDVAGRKIGGGKLKSLQALALLKLRSR